jgi:hypothetical protein
VEDILLLLLEPVMISLEQEHEEHEESANNCFLCRSSTCNVNKYDSPSGLLHQLATAALAI